MSYSRHFKPARDYIDHTNAIVSTITDPGVKQQYMGFIATSTVTAFELAIKEVLYEFAEKKHPVFGNFVQSTYKAINGRITLEDLRTNHIPRFGEKYVNRFKREIERQEQDYLQENGRSIKSSYGQILVCRHTFVHQGIVPSNATYDEIVNSFEPAKKVVDILNQIMVR